MLRDDAAKLFCNAATGGSPLSTTSAGANQYAIATSTVIASATSPTMNTAIPATPIKRPNDRKSPSGKGHLLVVDDHQDTCLGMKMLLERRGYQITLAHSADQAIEKAQAEKFDLLISDIGLPDRSGYELMKELRAKNALRGIALSGFGMENDISQARAAGFSEHLTKPINFDRLDEAIRNLLVDDR